jgi:hypothetical protein
MNASTKATDRRPEAQDDQPAKGGTEQPHRESYPSGDSPKRHGDKLEHAIDQSSKEKKTG